MNNPAAGAVLELCAFNIQSCRIAQQNGAGRIELCAEPQVGGTTPSHGLITFALQELNIPVFPMIRPRGGNFVYDSDDLEIMRRDIEVCKQLGCTGIATGVLLPDGRIDTAAMKQIVDRAYPMAVTCHKAFDRTPDAFEALESVIAAGCTRVLTSGLCRTAEEGIPILTDLVKKAAGRVIIMPGGSVRSSNIARLQRQTGAAELHSSALINKDQDYIADAAEVRGLVAALGVQAGLA